MFWFNSDSCYGSCSCCLLGVLTLTPPPPSPVRTGDLLFFAANREGSLRTHLQRKPYSAVFYVQVRAITADDTLLTGQLPAYCLLLCVACLSVPLQDAPAVFTSFASA